MVFDRSGTGKLYDMGGEPRTGTRESQLNSGCSESFNARARRCSAAQVQAFHSAAGHRAATLAMAARTSGRLVSYRRIEYPARADGVMERNG